MYTKEPPALRCRLPAEDKDATRSAMPQSTGINYKSTLNLPRTGFPMRAALGENEPKTLSRWRSGGLYDAVQAARAADPFFRALRHAPRAGETSALPFEPGFAVGVVVGGRGAVRGGRGVLPLELSVTFAVPAAASGSTLEAGPDGLELIWCLPPAQPPPA